jgi:hypothetical protein
MPRIIGGTWFLTKLADNRNIAFFRHSITKAYIYTDGAFVIDKVKGGMLECVFIVEDKGKARPFLPPASS